MLSPHLLRKKARSTEAGIGVGGEKLSAYLGTLSPEKRGRLAEALRAFYPHLTDLNVSSLRAGWKKLAVLEEFGGRRLETEAAHMNDGMLRILAVLTQLASGRSMVLLDEIENGINQELIEILVDTLVHSPHQTMVTTHSPLILNYLDDVVAKQAVQFVYKTPEGETRVRPFFSLDRMAEKLRTMGPGDAFVDTDLKRLTEECIALDREEMRGAEIEK
ncbi:hypothetical protein GCM10027256_34260 [Novispirillum itersonii subsp. nipponicum]